MICFYNVDNKKLFFEFSLFDFFCSSKNFQQKTKQKKSQKIVSLRNQFIIKNEDKEHIFTYLMN